MAFWFLLSHEMLLSTMYLAHIINIMRYFHRGPSMYGINYQRSVYMLVVLICSRIKYTNISLRRVTHTIKGRVN